jgi:hypothetical protein
MCDNCICNVIKVTTSECELAKNNFTFVIRLWNLLANGQIGEGKANLTAQRRIPGGTNHGRLLAEQKLALAQISGGHQMTAQLFGRLDFTFSAKVTHFCISFSFSLGGRFQSIGTDPIFMELQSNLTSRDTIHNWWIFCSAISFSEHKR